MLQSSLQVRFLAHHISLYRVCCDEMKRIYPESSSCSISYIVMLTSLILSSKNSLYPRSAFFPTFFRKQPLMAIVKVLDCRVGERKKLTERSVRRGARSDDGFFVFQYQREER